MNRLPDEVAIDGGPDPTTAAIATKPHVTTLG